MLATHGTLTRYQQGCRCLACGAANTRACRDYRQQTGGLVSVDRDVLSDLLNEIFPFGLTADSPRGRELHRLTESARS